MGRVYRVLIIDDDPSLRMLVRVLLEHEGFELLQAPDGEIGVALATGERPDCILLDVAIPRRSGLDVYRDLQDSSAAAGRRSGPGVGAGITATCTATNAQHLRAEVGRQAPYE